MNPEERHLLERAVKLSEDNNEILHAMRRTARWATLWGIIKIVIFVAPFLIAYFYLEPYFVPIQETFKQTQELWQTINQ